MVRKYVKHIDVKDGSEIEFHWRFNKRDEISSVKSLDDMICSIGEDKIIGRCTVRVAQHLKEHGVGLCQRRGIVEFSNGRTELILGEVRVYL